MPVQLRVVRRRMGSVQSIMRITRAQQVIAASRLVRAQRRVEQAKPYTQVVTDALSAVGYIEGEISHALLERREQVRAAAVLVITSDRGFAGSYNANVLNTAGRLVERLRQDGVEPKLYVVGRKGLASYRFRQRLVEQSWTGLSDAPRYDDADEIAGTLLSAFLQREVDAIHAVFTHFVSPATQRPEAVRFVPLVVVEAKERPPRPIPRYEFEPDAEAVLASLLPRYVTVRIYAALLEAAASEQAARLRAMAAATDNAEELEESLTREYNRARQAVITQEILEITAAAGAVNPKR